MRAMPPTEHCFHASDSVLLPCARLQECKIADPNLLFAMSFNKLCTSVEPDNIILMDNGVLPFKVEPVASDHVMCDVMSGGKLSNARTATCPACTPSENN